MSMNELSCSAVSLRWSAAFPRHSPTRPAFLHSALQLEADCNLANLTVEVKPLATAPYRTECGIAAGAVATRLHQMQQGTEFLLVTRD